MIDVEFQSEKAEIQLLFASKLTPSKDFLKSCKTTEVRAVKNRHFQFSIFEVLNQLNLQENDF